MLKRFFTLLMVLIVSLGTVGCSFGQTGNGGSGVMISIMNFDGGVGSEWLYNATQRFSILKEQEEYIEGVKGVSFDIAKSMTTGVDQMNTSGYNIYFDEARTDVRGLTAKGWLVDITDIVTEKLTEYGETKSIEDKLDPISAKTLKNDDGHYFALPYYETLSGFTFDESTFVDFSLYLAAPEETNVTTYESKKFGETIRLVKNIKENPERKKSCGNDGEYGTTDDGFPTSLTELLALCEYMKNVKNIAPFTLNGGSSSNYSNYLVSALWASLAGYDNIKQIYGFNGEITAVKSVGTEKLFPGIDYVYAPVTEKVTLTEQTGYRCNDMVERYYALAFLKICQEEGWFYSEADKMSTTASIAQNKFIYSKYNGTPSAMLIEGSYWMQESERNETLSGYYNLTDEDKPMGWVSLPTAFNEKVTVGQPRQVAGIEMSHSYATINEKGMDENPGLLRACKEFLQFLGTDSELQAFTMQTGIPRGGVNYELEEKQYNSLDKFKQTVWDIRKKSKILYGGSDSVKFKNNQTTLEIAIAYSPVFQPKIAGTTYNNCRKPFTLNNPESLWDVFNATRFTQSYWESLN